MPRLSSLGSALRSQCIPSAFSQGTRDGFVCREAVVVDALMKRAVFDSRDGAQLTDRQGLSVVLVGLRSARVLPLLQHRCPSAVLRLVVPVVVDAFNRVLRRGTWSHVGAESADIIQPFGAHDDASAAVMLKLWGLRVAAAFLDACPNLVFRCSAQSVAELRVKAATRAFQATVGLAPYQIPSRVRMNLPAHALTICAQECGFYLAKRLQDRPVTKDISRSNLRQFVSHWVSIVFHIPSAKPCLA